VREKDDADAKAIAIYVIKPAGGGGSSTTTKVEPAVDPSLTGVTAELSKTDVKENDKITVTIKDSSAPKGRAAVTTFAKDSYYTVTVNEQVIEHVLCEVDHVLTVEYTIKAADLEGDTPKITVKSIENGTEPDGEHTCSAETLTKKEAVPGKDCQTKGTGEYWECTCKKLYSDAAAKTEIQKAPEGVEGEHDYQIAPVENDEKQHVETCSVCQDKTGKTPEAHTFKVSEDGTKHVCDCGAEHDAQYASESEGADCNKKTDAGCTVTKPGASA
ncbi:hypothetical protein, partial [uncultured Oscillibacter sp.]|uniref:hypothetical protein n=1 Tax=uncultured Oscillibacter sp. TaxID=876091 RepID=UPI00260940AD